MKKRIDKLMTNAMDILLITILPLFALAMLITAAVTMQITYWVLFGGSAVLAIIAIMYFIGNKTTYVLTEKGIVVTHAFKKKTVAYSDVKGIGIVGGYIQAGKRRSGLEEEVTLKVENIDENGEKAEETELCYYEAPYVSLFSAEMSDLFCYDNMYSDDCRLLAGDKLLIQIPFDAELLAKLSDSIKDVSISKSALEVMEKADKAKELSSLNINLTVHSNKLSYEAFLMLVQRGAILTLTLDDKTVSFTRNTVYRKNVQGKTEQKFTYSALGRISSYDSIEELIEKEQIFDGAIKEKWETIMVQ